MGIIIAIHVIVCIGLIGLILIQRGRGGGFVDSFQNLESVFGTKTSGFLTRSTSVLATIFFITCLSLAFFSLRQGKSLIRNVPIPPPTNTTQQQGAESQQQAPAPEANPEAQPQAQQQPAAQGTDNASTPAPQAPAAPADTGAANQTAQ